MTFEINAIHSLDWSLKGNCLTTFLNSFHESLEFQTHIEISNGCTLPE